VTDDQLVRDALLGRQDAYTGLLQRYERPVFSLIARLIQDPGVAEELAQETFLKAFR
jgi:RNA polymerase sigma-70 factor (ECF subfamily)